jgi:hypothetical protein
MDYDAHDALLHHIFRQTQGDAWLKPSAENVHAGVCLRIQPGQFRVFPYENRFLEPFEAAIRVLNPVVAVKVRSAAVHVALSSVTDDADAIYLDDDTRIQILDSMIDLPRADKEQCGAFIVGLSSCMGLGCLRSLTSFSHDAARRARTGRLVRQLGHCHPLMSRL